VVQPPEKQFPYPAPFATFWTYLPPRTCTVLLPSGKILSSLNLKLKEKKISGLGTLSKPTF